MGQCLAVAAEQPGKADAAVECSSAKNGQPFPLQIYSRSFLQDYDVCREVLGSGASGIVRVVKRKNTGEKFALKVLRDVQVARREIELQHYCQHSHVVRIIDVYENILNENRCLFVVLELMEGGPLFDRIRRGRLTEREAARIMRDVGSAVAHMHSLNVAHRDLKPENMLYTKNGILKLADFGFAKQNTDGGERPLKTACFTNYYAPPEKLLMTDPAKRLAIEEMMSDKWIVRCFLAPKTPLFTSNINDQILQDIHETMGRELTGMRVTFDEIVIKPLNESNNRILARRKLTGSSNSSPAAK